MNRDGSSSRVLPAKAYQDIEYHNPKWARDGSGVYVFYDEHGHTKLAFCTMQGELKQLATDLGAGGLAYGFGASFTVARDGRCAYTHTDPKTPGDIAVLKAGVGNGIARDHRGQRRRPGAQETR